MRRFPTATKTTATPTFTTSASETTTEISLVIDQAKNKVHVRSNLKPEKGKYQT